MTLVGVAAMVAAVGAGDVTAAGLPFQTGDVLAGVGAGQIRQFRPDGTLVQTLNNTSGSSEQTGMCFDNFGNLYSTNFTNNSMAKFDNMGNLLTFPWGTGFNSHAESCVYDGAGHIYVGQADGGRKVRKLDLSGTLLAEYSAATQSRGTDWIDLAADGCTLFYTSEGSSVKRYDVCTSTQLADFATGLGSCFALRIRPNGEVMVACTSQVHRLSSSGTVIQSYPASGFTPSETFLFAMNLDPDNVSFWTGGISSRQIYRINIATGAQMTTFNAGIVGSSMAGLAVVGEITAIATPTPGPTQPPPTPTSPPEAIPLISGNGLAIFIGILALAGVLLLWRRTH